MLKKKFERWLASREIIIVGSILSLNLLLGALLFDPKPDLGGDNTMYVMLAESILRTGDGYAQNYSPGPSEPHTRYPFIYPLLLSPLVAFFGRNFAALKILPFALGLGSILLFYLVI